MPRESSQKSPRGRSVSGLPADTVPDAPVLDVLEDSVLNNFVGQFEARLADLAAGDPLQHREAATQLCRLSRRIFLRLQPVGDSPPCRVKEIVALFTSAADRVRAEGDKDLEHFRTNIRKRGSDLL